MPAVRRAPVRLPFVDCPTGEFFQIFSSLETGPMSWSGGLLVIQMCLCAGRPSTKRVPDSKRLIAKIGNLHAANTCQDFIVVRKVYQIDSRFTEADARVA
jgi:hypothetical protein